MGIGEMIARFMGRGERAVPDWQVEVKVDGLPRTVTLPGALGAAWARSPIGSDEYARALAEIHRRIAFVPTLSGSNDPQPIELVAA